LTRPRSPSPLGVLLEEARDVTARAGGIVIDRETWRRAVGTRIAARTEPGRLRGSVLTLHVASPAWAQELSFFSGEILKRVNELGVRATSLRFQVRPEAGKRPAAASTHIPPRPRAELSPEMLSRLAGVSDPALRKAIAEAASMGLGRDELNSKRRAPGPAAAGARSAPKGRAPSPPPKRRTPGGR
jgi:hypothetical protein